MVVVVATKVYSMPGVRSVKSALRVRVTTRWALLVSVRVTAAVPDKLQLLAGHATAVQLEV